MKMTKTNKVIGIALASVLLITIINSTYYFLAILKLSFVEWIVFNNACAPSSIAYLVGFVAFWLTRKYHWLTIALVPILFLGTMGLFVFPWEGENLIVQFSHIIMTLNAVWGLYNAIKSVDYKSLSIGLLTSVLLFVPFIAFTQYYCRNHAEDVAKIINIK